MEPIVALAVPLRWLHVVSFVVLIGGIFYARYFVGSLSPRFRGWIFASIAGLLVSGVYTFLTKPSFPAGYHMWFGIKMLLALHIFVVGVLLAAPSGDDAKRLRSMTGVVYSGLAIFLISSWLRWISVP